MALISLSGIWQCRTPSAGFTTEISAAGVDRTGSPIQIPLPAGAQAADYYQVIDKAAGDTLWGQRDSSRMLVIMPEETWDPNTSKTFQVIPYLGTKVPTGVRIDTTGGRIQVFVGARPVMNYWRDMQYPADTLPAYYQRNGFIHPMYTPGGQVITDGFPKGHTHQHGIFFAWVRTHYQGMPVDFWNQHQKTGTVRHIAVTSVEEGPVFGQFSCELHYMFRPDSTTYTPIVKELWTVRVYARSDYFLWDLLSQQRGVQDSVLHIEKYHYGGMAVRGSKYWNDLDFRQDESNPQNLVGEGQGGFLTSEGKTRIEANHSRPFWVSMYGEVEGAPVGLAAMGHPENFRFPQPVRVHPTMPYFVFTPSVLGPFDLGKEDLFVSRFRFVTHQGKPDPAFLDRIWAQYETPAAISGGE